MQAVQCDPWANSVPNVLNFSALIFTAQLKLQLSCYRWIDYNYIILITAISPDIARDDSGFTSCKLGL